MPPSEGVDPLRPRLTAKLDVAGTSESLYVAEWAPPNSDTVQYVVFVGRDKSPSTAEPWTAVSDYLNRPLGLWEWAEYGGGWVDASVGTLDRSVDAVRLTFTKPECGAETYPADGPFLRSVPERRLFMLDQSNGCLWKTAEALVDGKVVQTLVKPAAPQG